MNIKRGERVNIIAEAVPEDSVDSKNYKRESALVIWNNLYDSRIGFHHKVMFNAGSHGVIFKHVLESEVIS